MIMDLGLKQQEIHSTIRIGDTRINFLPKHLIKKLHSSKAFVLLTLYITEGELGFIVSLVCKLIAIFSDGGSYVHTQRPENITPSTVRQNVFKN